MLTKMDQSNGKVDNEATELTFNPSAGKRKYEILYLNATLMTYFHIGAVYALYLCFVSQSVRWETIAFNFILYTMAMLGITAGAHRLWAHRTYKAKMPLQIMLMLFNCIAFQRTILKWARDHRLHHKHSDTDADPHNATRGLFFCHIGWTIVKKHPEALEKGKLMDSSDLTSNPVVVFQDKYGFYLFTCFCLLVPTLVPIVFWKESLTNSWHVTLLRYVFSLNATFLINSLAHRWGYRPYDQRIMPTQNIPASFFTFGEGFHNYHHVFPWDYRAAELGNDVLNFSTLFIDFFAWIGWAYDLKTTSNNMIKTRMQRTGDGSNLWGIDDSLVK